MSEIINSVILNADYLILMLVRVGGLVISSPIFGRVNIPNMAKIGLVLALTYLFFILFPPGEMSADIEYGTVFGFFLYIANELIIGIALGFVLNVFFTLTYTAGQIIDMQMGFGIVNVYDPQNNTQIPMVGNILNLMLLATFFAVNGHLRLVEIIHMTLEKMPIGTLFFRPQIGMVAAEVFSLSFTLGVMVAMPMIASGIVLEFSFGMLMRTVPQLHMFVVGVPLKTLLGFLMLFMIFPMFVNFSENIFTEMFIAVEKMFSTLMTVP